MGRVHVRLVYCQTACHMKTEFSILPVTAKNTSYKDPSDGETERKGKSGKSNIHQLETHRPLQEGHTAKKFGHSFGIGTKGKNDPETLASHACRGI